MRNHHPKNERTKRVYLLHLTHAKRRAAATVAQVAMALADFEASTGWKDFALFRVEQAHAYKRKLQEHVSADTGKPLAIATINARLLALKAFFVWLAGRAGYRRITGDMADHFNPSANDGRIGSARRERPTPTIDQIRTVVQRMPFGTDMEKRDRALIAFALISGARDMALATFRLKHVDVDRRLVFQDGRDVATKRGKTFPTWFFPVGDDFETIVVEWIAHLRDRLSFGDDDPLFPATAIGIDGDGGFTPKGLKPEHWSTAAPIRKILKAAFTTAGLPYFNPHTFRNTLVLEGQRRAFGPEALKAWSQNLGHDQVLTTFTSYGAVEPNRQEEILNAMRSGGRTYPAGLTDRDIIRIAGELMTQHAR